MPKMKKFFTRGDIAGRGVDPEEFDVSPEAFPEGMFPNQEALDPRTGETVVFMGIDKSGVSGFVTLDLAGTPDDYLKRDSSLKTKKDFIDAGFKFLS